MVIVTVIIASKNELGNISSLSLKKFGKNLHFIGLAEITKCEVI